MVSGPVAIDRLGAGVLHAGEQGRRTDRSREGRRLGELARCRGALIPAEQASHRGGAPGTPGRDGTGGSHGS